VYEIGEEREVYLLTHRLCLKAMADMRNILFAPLSLSLCVEVKLKSAALKRKIQKGPNKKGTN